MFTLPFSFVLENKLTRNTGFNQIRLCDLKARFFRKLIVLMYVWGLLMGFPSEVLARSTKTSLEQQIQINMKAFLSAETSSAKVEIAKCLVTEIVESADAESLRSDLAIWTGALVGISGTNAPVIAAAIVCAAGPRYQDVAVAAVGLVIPHESDKRKKAWNAVVAVPGMDRSTAKIILEHPERVLSEETQQGVMELFQLLGFLKTNWDPVTSRPTQDLFPDQDGGETPASRNTEAETDLSISGSE